VLSTLTLMAVMAAGALMSGNAVAGVLGALSATACATSLTGLVLGLRRPAFQRFFEQMAVGAVWVVERLRHAPGQPDALVARALTRLGAVRFRRSDWALAVGLASLNWLGDAACLALALTAARLAVPLRDVLLVWSMTEAAGWLDAARLDPQVRAKIERENARALLKLSQPAALRG